jgi:hypothetical protein
MQDDPDNHQVPTEDCERLPHPEDAVAHSDDAPEVFSPLQTAFPLTPWEELSKGAQKIYYKILSLAHCKGFAHISTEKIAEYVARSIRSVRYYFKELLDGGYIETQRGPRNRYLFLRPLVVLSDEPPPRRVPTPKLPFLRPQIAYPIAQPKAKSCTPLTFTKQTEKNDNTQTQESLETPLEAVVVTSLQELGCDTRTAKALAKTFTKEQIDKAIETYKVAKNVRCVPAFIRSALVNAWQNMTAEATTTPKSSNFMGRLGPDGKIYRMPKPDRSGTETKTSATAPSAPPKSRYVCLTEEEALMRTMQMVYELSVENENAQEPIRATSILLPDAVSSETIKPSNTSEENQSFPKSSSPEVSNTEKMDRSLRNIFERANARANGKRATN